MWNKVQNNIIGINWGASNVWKTLNYLKTKTFPLKGCDKTTHFNSACAYQVGLQYLQDPAFVNTANFRKCSYIVWSVILMCLKWWRQTFLKTKQVMNRGLEKILHTQTNLYPNKKKIWCNMNGKSLVPNPLISILK